MGRKPIPGQLDLGLFPEEQGRPAVATPAAPAIVAVVIPTATIAGPLDFIPHESATREERLMLALRRDLATLAGPATYVCDRAFYEERVAGYRAMLSA